VHQALTLAKSLKASGKYDLFRGQICSEWRVCPSALRVPKELLPATEEKVQRFDHWTQLTPGVEVLARDADAMWAVAQHYGLPTLLLDWTRNPTVAAFFALDGRHESHERGVIFLLNSADFEAWVATVVEVRPDLSLVGIKRTIVPDHHRLEAQEGVFMHAPFYDVESGLKYGFDRIEFRHTSIDLGVLRHEIYPERKTNLEILLDQYFDNENALEVSEDLEARFSNVGRWQDPALESASKYFQAGAPEPLPSWSRPERERWWQIQPESFIAPRNAPVRVIRAHFALEPAALQAEVERQIESALQDVTLRNHPVVWRVESTGEPSGVTDPAAFADALSLKVERLWDGLRRLPTADEDIAYAIGVCVALYVPLAIECCDLVSTCRRLFPDAIRVGFTAYDGASAQSCASAATLISALRPDLAQLWSERVGKEDRANIEKIMLMCPWPDRLFNLTALARCFARQCAPIQVLRYARDLVVFYSPVQLQFFGVP
jgi:hypothetical protein